MSNTGVMIKAMSASNVMEPAHIFLNRLPFNMSPHTRWLAYTHIGGFGRAHTHTHTHGHASVLTHTHTHTQTQSVGMLPSTHSHTHVYP